MPPYAESVREAAAADVLLVIEAPTSPSLILPTKLVDSLAFGKPILGLVPGEGPPADLLRQVGCPQAAPNNAGAIARALAGMLVQWQEGKLTVSPQFAKVAKQYDIRQTARLFDGVLAQIIQRRPEPQRRISEDA